MIYAPIPYFPQFQTAEVCAAARIDSGTLKNWLNRGEDMQVIQPSRPAGSPGRVNMFSWCDLLAIALTAELVRLGLPVRRAYLIALGFSHVSDIVPVDLGQPAEAGVVRQPSELYEDDLTFIVATAGEDASRVVRLPVNASIFSSELGTILATHDSVVMVNVNVVVGKVCAVLGIDRDFFRQK